MFGKFRWFINYYKKRYIIGIIFLLLSDLVSLYLPFITGRLIDLIYNQSINMEEFIRIITFTVFMILLKYFLAMGWSYNVFRAYGTMEYLSRKKLMTKFLGQSQEFFEKNSTGSLMGKSTNDVQQVSDLAGYGTLALVDATILPLSILIVSFITVDFKLTLLSVLPLPLIAYLYFKISDMIYEKSKIVNQNFDSLNNNVLEDVEGVRIIRVYNNLGLRTDLFNKRAEKLAESNIELVKYQALMQSLERVITSITFIIAIGYGSFMIYKGNLSIGKLVSFTYYLNMMIWPMFALGDFINLKQQASAAMDRIDEILQYKEDIKDSSMKENLDDNVDIEFENLYFKYPTSKNYILNDINLAIESGSSIGILGKTGSGKTTLIKQLLDLYTIDKDKLILEGKSAKDINFKNFKGKIGYVPQMHMVFSDTIKNNIKFSKPDATEEEIERAIKLADFKKDIEQFPQGLDTITGERGISLSGGQKQRLAIARALIKDPEILILDDSMSAVDANTEKNILENLKNFRKNKTTIIIAHRISQVQDCDNIIVLDDGKIVEEGSHQDLMSYDSWYKKQYYNQILGAINEE
ncbi:MAG: ABC transporter ATP-binding protein [Peptoniphilaceae bacterium]|nr:ABC transporter ATP-binding protein [Peptoniphilaceae bacterium]MDY6019620.1 ABC transporter ATP-binding protein [Anaerococcus sp.]